MVAEVKKLHIGTKLEHRKVVQWVKRLKVDASDESMTLGKPLTLGKKEKGNLYQKLKPNLVSNQKLYNTVKKI